MGTEGMIVSPSAMHRLAGVERYLDTAEPAVAVVDAGVDGGVLCMPDVHATLIISTLHMLSEPFGDPNPLHAPAADGDVGNEVELVSPGK